MMNILRDKIIDNVDVQFVTEEEELDGDYITLNDYLEKDRITRILEVCDVEETVFAEGDLDYLKRKKYSAGGSEQRLLLL